MGSLFSPSIPQRNEPNAPTPSDPAIQAAERSQLTQQGAMYGRAATVLTSGQGDTSPAPVAKKTLLGG
jgi:hypothetical protein